MRASFLFVGGFAVLVSRQEGDGCAGPPGPDVVPRGRIGVFGHAAEDGVGVVVDAVGVGTPADRELDPGDVILAVDGEPLTGPYAFHELVRTARGLPGTPVELVVDGAYGPRVALLSRRVISDCVPQRIGRLPTGDEVRELIEGSGCRDDHVQAVIRDGAIQVLWGGCSLASVTAAPDLHGGFVWRDGSIRIVEPGALMELGNTCAP